MHACIIECITRYMQIFIMFEYMNTKYENESVHASLLNNKKYKCMQIIYLLCAIIINAKIDISFSHSSCLVSSK